jgi:hypothetical protein
VISLIVSSILFVSNIFVLNKKINTFTDDVEYLLFVLPLIGVNIIIFLGIIALI